MLGGRIKRPSSPDLGQLAECLQRGRTKAGMVDLLSMFRRRPAKRGKAGFARSREDITALSGSMGDMLTKPVRDAPPLARTAPSSVLELPHAENPPPAPRPAPPRPAAPK